MFHLLLFHQIRASVNSSNIFNVKIFLRMVDATYISVRHMGRRLPQKYVIHLHL